MIYAIEIVEESGEIRRLEGSHADEWLYKFMLTSLDRFCSGGYDFDIYPTGTAISELMRAYGTL